MPLYEYQCDACGHRFEKIQKFSDPLQDTCPKCGGPVHKLMSSPAIQFKGSGFYITDYAKKDHVASEKADGAKDTQAGGGDTKDAKGTKDTQAGGGDTKDTKAGVSESKDTKSGADSGKDTKAAANTKSTADKST
jgi:putative FmdB family regulatory protein